LLITNDYIAIFKSQGSNATGDMCSKCWNEKQVREKKANNPIPGPSSSIPNVSRPQPVKTEVVSNVVNVSMTTEPMTQVPPMKTSTTAPKKRSKKKNSYKAMMAGIVQTNSDRNIEKEKEGIRKVTGGGAFSKIDKI